MMKTLAISLAVVFLWQWMFPPQPPVKPLKPQAGSQVGSQAVSGGAPQASGALISELSSQAILAQVQTLEPTRP